MRYHDKFFCKAFSEFFNLPIDSPKEIDMAVKNGVQISDFCDHYFKVRLEQSALRHFSLDNLDFSSLTSGEKAKFILIGFFIGALAFLILCLLIFGTFYFDKL